MAGMIVQHNMNSINAYNRLSTNIAGLKKSSKKLSSGYRITGAGDDAAGLAISEKMRTQIRGLNQSKRNSQDGISMIQTYEGALQETHSILHRMKELAVQSANGTYNDKTDRDAIQLEFEQLNDELNQIADTDFNGVISLNGGTMSDGVAASNGLFTYPATNKVVQPVGSGSVAGHAKIDVEVAAGTTDLGKYEYIDSVIAGTGIAVKGWYYNNNPVAAPPFSVTDENGNAITTFSNGDVILLKNPVDGVSVPNSYENAQADMTFVSSIALQVGARSKDAVNFTFKYDSDGIGGLEADLDVSATGLETDKLTLITQSGANTAIDQIDFAINKVSMVRATFGAMQNRLEHKIDNLTSTAENITEAESTIRDTDMAFEMMNYTKANILQQAAQSMLSQANQQPQSILQLLG